MNENELDLECWQTIGRENELVCRSLVQNTLDNLTIAIASETSEAFILADIAAYLLEKCMFGPAHSVLKVLWYVDNTVTVITHGDIRPIVELLKKVPEKYAISTIRTLFNSVQGCNETIADCWGRVHIRDTRCKELYLDIRL